MPTSPAELLRNWHDFYILAGTASATLIGLMFVAVSIGSSIFSEEHRSPMKAFLTPTVVHFATVLLACLLVTIPTQTWFTLGGLLGAIGIAGAVHCGSIVVQVIVRHSFAVDATDRLFYALVPLLGYTLLAAAAALLVAQSATSAELIAAAILTLLIAAIRNAWDMMVWIVIKVPNGRGPSP